MIGVEGHVMATKRRRLFDTKSFLAHVGDGRSIGKYRKGQIVFSQGDPGDAVFYIQKGKVQVTVHETYDDELAWLSDTAFEDLQTTSLESLREARHSQQPMAES